MHSRILFNTYAVSHILVHHRAYPNERFRGSVKAEGRGNEGKTERELFVGVDPIIHSGSRERGTCLPRAVGRTRHRGIFLFFFFLGVPTALCARTCRIDSPRLVYKLCEWHFVNCHALSHLFANPRR